MQCHCKKEKINQRQTYIRKSKQLVRDTFNRTHPKRRKKALKPDRKLNTIAGRLVRELQRELPKDRLANHQKELNFHHQVLKQKRTDKNKIYSIHKPYTACIAKRKAHKKYEFGNKIGLITTSKTLIITAIKSFTGNPHDSKTIEPLLDQLNSNLNYSPKEMVYDRGGKEQKQIRRNSNIDTRLQAIKTRCRIPEKSKKGKNLEDVQQ